ncbi:MAG: hypothetical protein JXR78_16755 [Victivallales bacterium]|nr:hypothetical protein [Victivallales bacterium]
MATFKSSAIPADQLVPQLLNSVHVGGKLHIVECKYTGTGTEVAGDLIELCRVRKGFKVIPHLSFVNGNQADTKLEIVGLTKATGVAIDAHSSLPIEALNLSEELTAEDTVLTGKLVGGGMTAGAKLIVTLVYAQL